MKKLVMILVMLCLAVPAIAYDDVMPTDAYTMATTDQTVFILDVRTVAEWTWVGHPGVNKSDAGADLEGKVINASVMVEILNELVENPFFIKSVKKMFPDKENVTLITMCRSGGRSITAAKALEAAGYKNVMNMLTGFEGGKDADGYRTVSGWKNDGLPYNNSRDGGYTIGFHGKGNAYGLYK